MNAPAPEPAPVVTRKLTKRYDELVAVDHLDLELRHGEIFGLLGQNGAGKTTTILMLLGLTELPAVGDTVELRLTFQEGGEVTVQAEVRAG